MNSSQRWRSHPTAAGTVVRATTEVAGGSMHLYFSLQCMKRPRVQTRKKIKIKFQEKIPNSQLPT